jgi:hypothetical protein
LAKAHGLSQIPGRLPDWLDDLLVRSLLSLRRTNRELAQMIARRLQAVQRGQLKAQWFVYSNA